MEQIWYYRIFLTVESIILCKILILIATRSLCQVTLTLLVKLKFHTIYNISLGESYKLLTLNDSIGRSQGLSGVVIAEATQSFHVYQPSEKHSYPSSIWLPFGSSWFCMYFSQLLKHRSFSKIFK